MKNKLTLAKTSDLLSGDSASLTVVMIHGIASDSHTYDSALKHFKEDAGLKGVRFVTFDLLGAGKSLKDDENLNYDYDDQVEALNNAIDELGIDTPLVLVGHSLGTFIVTRYTSIYPDKVSELILLSPPIFTKRDFANPAFAAGIEGFKQMVGAKAPEILKEKSFINSMDKIVLDQTNFDVLAGLTTPTTLIFGNGDQLIASYNVPYLLKQNDNITAIETESKHGVTHDKYEKLASILKKILKGDVA